MLVALQLAGTAMTPPKVIVLPACVAPKFDPLIVTEVPAAPEVGDRLAIPGTGATVKVTPLLGAEFTFTTTLPVVAPAGTVVEMLVLLQLDTVAVVPLNCTVLLPWLDPKFEPLIVTGVPTTPDVGDRMLIIGLDIPPPVLAEPTV